MLTAQSILNALAEPILISDSGLRAILANPALCHALEIGPGQLEGKLVQALFNEQNGERRLTSVLQSIVAGEKYAEDLELTCTLPSCSQKAFAVSARQLERDTNGNQMILVEIRDVTREKESEGKIQALNEAILRHSIDLEETNTELESFTHSVSHDLRTPLRLTNRIVHLLLEEYSNQLPAGAVAKIHMILDGTQQMGKLIEDLLTFSRIKREPIRKRRIDMTRLTREVVKELNAGYEDREIAIEIGELPSCEADRALLKQVYLNLLGNALKFTRPCEQARIEVGFTQRGSEAVYFVRDNGIGFEMSHAESIFLAFHRIHRTHDFEGSGVGLALVRRIVDRHGGRIWAESQVNEGAVFYFTLSTSG